MTINTNYKLILFGLFGFFLALSILPLRAYSAFTPEIYTKDSTPYNIPYSDWITKWWKWNLSIPIDKHPIANNNIKTCPVGISGQVVFLTQSMQGNTAYTCTIPAGHSIMAPIGTGECTSKEADLYSVPGDILRCATDGDKGISMKVTLDGNHIKNLPDASYGMNGFGPNYSITKYFNNTIIPNNFLQLDPGTWRSIAGGYFVLLKPIPAGVHELHIKASVLQPPPTDKFNFNYDTIFHLNVK